MEYQNIIYSVDDRIATIVLNRPEKMNALSLALRKELQDALVRAEHDTSVRVVIIKGAGRTFSAGYDLTDVENPAGTPVEIADKDHIASRLGVWFTIWNLLKPVIAQVHGYALAGGSELAFICDVTIMAENALTGYPPVRSFSTPDLLYHPWLAGMKQAKLLLFTGDAITGKEAQRIGLATLAVPEDMLESETLRIAKRIANIPTDIVSLSKAAVNRTYETMGFTAAIDWATKLHDLSHTTESMAKWKLSMREKGLSETLRLRDEPFGDYSARKQR